MKLCKIDTQFNLKKHIALILFIPLLFSSACKNNGGVSFTNDSASALIQIDNSIINSIKGYYKNQFPKNVKTVEVQTETTIEITYYNKPKTKDDTDYLLMALIIPKTDSLNDEKRLLIGDLNDDDIDDLLISVYTEGGGVGALSQRWNDYFIFLKEKRNYILTTIVSDKELVDCENGGRFMPINIKNGYINGVSYCYKIDDPSCCPSLTFSAKLKLKKEKLVIVDQLLLK